MSLEDRQSFLLTRWTLLKVQHLTQSVSHCASTICTVRHPYARYSHSHRCWSSRVFGRCKPRFCLLAREMECNISNTRIRIIEYCAPTKGTKHRKKSMCCCVEHHEVRWFPKRTHRTMKHTEPLCTFRKSSHSMLIKGRE